MITAGFLAEWALRSSILIVAGAALLKALRVKDPAVRLAVCAAMLAASLALPLLTASLPAVPVPTPPVAVVRPGGHVPNGPAISTIVEVAPLTTARHFDWSRAAVNVYLLGVIALTLRLCFGLAMAIRLRRRSWPTELPGVRESGGIQSPVTLGIARPAILLPTDWREWDAATLQGVLAHERSHIRRHDPAVQLLSMIHRALLWYSPMSWYLDRQIVRLAEEVSDDAAVAAVRDRSSYAEALLEFMRGADRHASWQGVPMARYGRPERRIHRILDATTLSRGVTRWSIAAILVCGLPLAYVVAAAQERLTFEVASVKPATVPEGVNISGASMTMSGGNREDFQRLRSTGGPGTTDPGRIHYPLVSLTGLLQRAYDSTYFEIKAPAWADTDIVAVDATMPSGTTKAQFLEMLQNLIIDRFQLKTHVETKEISGYALGVAKGGVKFKEASPTAPDPNPKDATPERRPREIGADGWPVPPRKTGPGLMFSAMPGERTRMKGDQVTLADLTRSLAGLLQSKVVDTTGLKGTYDITLTFAGHIGSHGPEALRESPPPSADPSAPEPLPDIFTALQSQLGLRLEQKKVAVEILVVDHIEKAPSGN